VVQADGGMTFNVKSGGCPFSSSPPLPATRVRDQEKATMKWCEMVGKRTFLFFPLFFGHKATEPLSEKESQSTQVKGHLSSLIFFCSLYVPFRCRVAAVRPQR